MLKNVFSLKLCIVTIVTGRLSRVRTMTMFGFAMDSMICGYHEYKSTWENPQIDDDLCVSMKQEMLMTLMQLLLKRYHWRASWQAYNSGTYSMKNLFYMFDISLGVKVKSLVKSSASSMVIDIFIPRRTCHAFAKCIIMRPNFRSRACFIKMTKSLTN